MQSEVPVRKPTRLKWYDYSTPGAYFVTICTKDRKQLFGQVKNGEMHLNFLGKLVDREILAIHAHYNNVRIDKYVIMPNHIHIIIVISASERINPFPTKIVDVSNIVGKFKAGVTRNVGNAFMHSAKNPIWQRSFHDHIIRNDTDYKKIWDYIDSNVINWKTDCFYSE